nr:uncharacterized protein LOC117856465 [Setaria viridis]
MATLDIWCHIHSLMPMGDAARVACVSQAFARFWRCHPNLVFTYETLGLKGNLCYEDDKMRHFTSKVDHILKKHSGIGVKTFKLAVGLVYNDKDYCHLNHFDSWLRIAVKPGIEELTLSLSSLNARYNFPCSLLSSGTRDSLRYLSLVGCNFHPTVKCGSLRSLTRQHLCVVHIKDQELACFLANSFSLERLEIRYCSAILCLKIPFLQRLSFLKVISVYNSHLEIHVRLGN